MSFVLNSKLLRNSIFRLAMVYAGIFSLSVILIFTFMYWATAGYMQRQTENIIAGEHVDLVEIYEQSGLPLLLNVINDRIFQPSSTSSLYLLTDISYKPVVGNLKNWPSQQQADTPWVSFNYQRNGVQHQGLGQQILLNNGYHLLVGQDTHELQKLQHLIWDAMLGGVIITLLLALVGGFMMSKTMMHRIEAINKTCHRIIEGDLTQRIATSGGNDDFDKLIHTLNCMLDQIEELMHGIKQVSDNIAHDLRTPLSRLRRRLDMLRISEQDKEVQELLLDQAINEADGLLATFKALLRITEVESGSRKANFQTLDLVPIVADLVELYEPLAQDKEQHLSWQQSQTSATLYGDRDLLFQALSNIIDNAIKYTPALGSIQIEIKTQGNQIELSISDSGPGIPESEQEKVLERFYRLELNRASPGNGLGLSLVAAIINLHQGQIHLTDNHPGLRITLSLPVNS